MTRLPFLLIVLVLVAGSAQAHHAEAATAPAPATAAAPASDAFGAVLVQYEAIRDALLHDRMDGVAAAAKSIATQAGDATPKSSTALAPVLKSLGAAAQKVAAAQDLASTRAAFGDLSDAMIAWRKLAGGSSSVVVHCPMANRSWVQPKGAIGNPYYGSSMATCGTIVTD